MSTTFGNLKTRIATVLLDPDGDAFTDSLLPELVQAGLVEVGRLLPTQYKEDLDPVANQMEYLLGSALFDEGTPEIDVVRVEVWDPTTDPESYIYEVNPAAGEASYADSGYSVWNGSLRLPTRIVRGLVGYEDQYVIRVWGYAPYAIPTSDDDIISMTIQAEQAVVKYARVEGLEMLLSNRDLFTQWQTRSGNSDISPAGLMNQLSMARADWRSYSTRIARLRSGV